MFRDPDVYPEPDAFIPERFLELHEAPDRELRDPKKIVFGFGRRCVFCYRSVFTFSHTVVAIESARDDTSPMTISGWRLRAL